MHEKLNSLPLTLSVKEMAKLLNISNYNAYALARSRDFPAIRIGKTIVISKIALLDWLSKPHIIETN